MFIVFVTAIALLGLLPTLVRLRIGRFEFHRLVATGTPAGSLEQTTLGRWNEEWSRGWKRIPAFANTLLPFVVVVAIAAGGITQVRAQEFQFDGIDTSFGVDPGSVVGDFGSYSGGGTDSYSGSLGNLAAPDAGLGSAQGISELLQTGSFGQELAGVSAISPGAVSQFVDPLTTTTLNTNVDETSSLVTALPSFGTDSFAVDLAVGSSPVVAITEAFIDPTQMNIQLALEQARLAEQARLNALQQARSAGRLGAEIPYFEAFNATGDRYGLDPRMLAAVAKAESGFRDDIITCRNPSSAGALGIMQFIPSTASGFGIDPCVPEQAIDAGARYLKGLFEQFNSWDLAFAGYNAGPGAVQQYGGIPPFRETQAYVPRVNQFWDEFRAAYPNGQLSGAAFGGEGVGDVIWPVTGPVTSEFGQRWGRHHAGIDLGPPNGTPIYAAKAGVVTFAGVQGGYGNIVILDHGGGFTTAYAHQSQTAAGVGEQLAQGQLLGYVGSTGDSTGPHLHFETRVNGVGQNPRNFLPAR